MSFSSKFFLSMNNNTDKFIEKFLIFLTNVPYVMAGAPNSIFIINYSGNKN